MRVKIEVTMDLIFPDDTDFSDESLRRWIEFHVAGWGGIPIDDPLCHIEPNEFIDEIHVSIN